jgi:hypothetical protein
VKGANLPLKNASVCYMENGKQIWQLKIIEGTYMIQNGSRCSLRIILCELSHQLFLNKRVFCIIFCF